MKWDNYNDLREGLQHLPATWYPDLLQAMVEAACDKDVFLPDGLVIFVKSVIDRKERES